MDEPRTPRKPRSPGGPRRPSSAAVRQRLAAERRRAEAAVPQPARPPRQERAEPRPERPEPRPADTIAPPAPAGWRQRLYRVPVVGAFAYVVSPPRPAAPSIPRRVTSWTAAVVFVLGLGMVGYPWAGQHYPFFFRIPVEKAIEWSNFLKDMEAGKIQSRLKGDFGSDALARKIRSRSLAEGDPLTRIQIPNIGVDTIVVEGTGVEALKAGAGHYPQTPLPGELGNVGIAGHRTTYGHPFNRIDELRPGDKVILTTPIGIFTYEVARDPWVTTPTDFGVVTPTPDAGLTLTSCNPKGSARQRIIVRAKLVRSEPVQQVAAGKKAA